VYRLLSLPLLLVIVLGIAACTGAPPRPQPPVESALDASARPLIAQGDYLAAAQLYLSAAKTAPENQRADLRLRAAELLADGQHWAQLEQVLAGIGPDSLAASQQARYQLLQAQLLLANRQPEAALNILSALKTPENLADHGRHYYQLRAQAYAQAGNPLEAARQLIWLDGLLDDPAKKLDNQYRIWEQLSNLSDEALETLKTAPPPDALSGWMELVLITREYRGDRDRWSSELSRWRARYPHHAAEDALLPDLLYQVAQFVSQANQIAVLLPLSGRTEDAAMAIRDGILAAFYHSGSPKPELHFYDTGGNAQLIWSVYQRAINDGADFVIGPLLKESIEALSQSGLLPIPVLALNHTDEVTENKDLPLYQFGLAPEDEARQVAQRAIDDGHQRLVALVPDSAWGSRVFAAFEQAFTQLGGQVLDVERYASRSPDFTRPIRHALNLDGSENRYQALQRLLGEKLNFEPRRRQDVQGVFVLAFPREARQIKPQLRFHHAGDLPVYSTSHVFQASVDPSIDRDMDGLMFCDIPWVLDQEGPWAKQRKQVQALWPERGLRYQRLFALGFDAYQVVPWLDTLQLPGFARFPGATGILSLDSDKQLHRTLEWARFNRGWPEKIQETLTTSTEGQNEPESDRR
jgi:outer membrane PBP1 activator LpoA protein